MAPFRHDEGHYGYRMGSLMGKSELVDTMVNDALWDTTGFNMHGHDRRECLHQRDLPEEVRLQPISREQLGTSLPSILRRRPLRLCRRRFSRRDRSRVVIKGQKGATPYLMIPTKAPYETPWVLGKLKPCFKKDSIVTAANSSAINDSAAALGRHERGEGQGWALSLWPGSPVLSGR